MDKTYIIGRSAMDGFTAWWESHLPSYLIIYCRGGEAKMLVQFEEYTISKNMVVLISPDMFPAFTSRSGDFEVSYCLMSREFAEMTLYGVPKKFFDLLYITPVIEGGGEIEMWIDMLEHISKNYTSYQCNTKIVENVVHNIFLVCFNLWYQQYGETPVERYLKRPERLCVAFYDLIFDNFKEQRETRFYADRLCITPNYLAMIMRQVCKETPKEAIDRQVILEMKYLIRNTDMNVGQMAIHLHFPDTSYMCRYFKKRTGVSISDYRKTCINMQD